MYDLMITMSDQGWGATSYGGYSSNVLMEVSVPVVSHVQCQTTMAQIANYPAITESMICAGGVPDMGQCQVLRF